MTAPARTYYLRWTLLILGITAWALTATAVDTLLSRPAPVRAETPARPRPPLVVPTNSLLPGEPVALTASLSLPGDSLRLPASSAPDSLLPRSTPLPFDEDRPASVAEAAPTTQGAPQTTDDEPVPSPHPRAAPAQSPQPQPSRPISIGGLVVDETMSPFGRTFYTAFFSVWQAPPTDGFYTVRVQEQPTPGRGTLVQVFVNDDVIFRARLQPQTNIADQALQAARRTYAYVRSGQGILRIY